YAIQGFMAGYISRINGNYHNVVGLPLSKLNRLLKIVKAL
ncbi:MAG: Maf family protein, partial [Oscillospiraceae bacterium]|nr:Maf family protein [Oscillospiraceae bacterium]